MPFYLTAEGGGTKLIAALYDERYRLINTARTTGTNTTCRRPEDIEKSIRDMVGELIRPEFGVKEIERLDEALLGSSDTLHRAVSAVCPIREHKHYGEGEAALGADECLYGLVAQSGTGSDAFLIQPDCKKTVGGWGPHLGDEGSGYDIGLRALRAVIYASDHRGPATMLTELVMERLGLRDRWELVGLLLHDPDMRRTVASCALLVSRAAHAGDAAALDIYAKAADEMAAQVIAALSFTGGRFTGPIVTSGGAWRGHPSFGDRFAERIHAVYPDAKIEYPLFEPVVGPVFLRMTSEGVSREEADRVLRREFAVFLDPNRQRSEQTNDGGLPL